MKYIKLLTILVVLVFTGLFLRATDFNKVAESLQQVGYNFVWLIIISFSSYLCGTIAWRYCMGAEGKSIPLFDLFITRHVGETVGVVNPTSIVAGEAVKIYLLRNYPVQKKTVITSVLLSRVLMILTQLLIFASVAIYTLVSGNILLSAKGVLNLFYIIPVTVVIIAAVIKKSPWFKKLFTITKPGRWISGRTVKLREKIGEAKGELSVFYRANKASLGMSVMFFVLHWLLGSLEFFVILKLLGVATHYISVVFVDMSVILFKSAGAFVPAQIGVEEYGNKVMLSTIGITALEVWVTASILRRARLLFWIVFGLGAYFFIDRKKNNILQPDGTAVYKS